MLFEKVLNFFMMWLLALLEFLAAGVFVCSLFQQASALPWCAL
jgi:hypothetical protein